MQIFKIYFALASYMCGCIQCLHGLNVPFQDFNYYIYMYMHSYFLGHLATFKIIYITYM